MNSSFDALTKAGFGHYESEIYSILVTIGESLVSAILEHTKLSRATVYYALSDLLVKGFVEYRKEGRNAYYAPVHPTKVFSLLDERRRDLSLLEEEMKLTVESLTASYNISNKKPGVRFFVGEEMQEMADKVFLESLDAKETVYSITNRDALEDHSAELLEKYMKQKKDTFYERVIVADSPKGRELAAVAEHDSSIDVKILPFSVDSFQAGMDMYDGKVIYGTHKSGDSVTVMIEDPELCKMQRKIFEALWSLL